jgi:hypothetical protein
MSPRDFDLFAMQAKHEREAREWQEWDQTATVPTGEASDSDFGAFIEAMVSDGARIEKRVAKPMPATEKQREWLERAHSDAQKVRFA